MSAEVVMLRWIDVEHACEDGYHEFTSPQVPGFYIVSNDLEVAYADIPAALAALLEADFGGSFTVKPEIPFDQYVRSLPESHRTNRFAVESRILRGVGRLVFRATASANPARTVG